MKVRTAFTWVAFAVLMMTLTSGALDREKADVVSVKEARREQLTRWAVDSGAVSNGIMNTAKDAAATVVNARRTADPEAYSDPKEVANLERGYAVAMMMALVQAKEDELLGGPDNATPGVSSVLADNS